MELWIRSQDRETLVKVNNLSLVHDTDTWEIINSYADHQYWELGTYTTKERALEVLNKIQERILNLQLVSLEERGKARKDVRITPYLECVYQMPKE